MIKFSAIASAPLAALVLGGCTWVALEEGGKRVRVVTDASNVQGCERREEITASVRDRIGFIERESAKVSDEVEALARNEAAQRGADTVMAMSDLQNGERIYQTYKCK